MNRLEKYLATQFLFLADNYESITQELITNLSTTPMSRKAITNNINKLKDFMLGHDLAHMIFQSNANVAALKILLIPILYEKWPNNVPFFMHFININKEYYLEIKNPKTALLKSVIDTYPIFFSHLSNPSKKQIKEFINKNGRYIEYVNDKFLTDEIIELSIMNNPYSYVKILKRNVMSTKKINSILINSLQKNKLNRIHEYQIDALGLMIAKNKSLSSKELLKIEYLCPELSLYAKKSKNYSITKSIIKSFQS